MDGGNGDPKGARPFPVHVDSVFGHIFHAVGSHFGKTLILSSHTKELVAGLHELLVAKSTSVQQLEVKTGSSA
ncbi:MAG: hypothetical protein A4E58_02520 [Syntrophorhabdus sp. PtaB.Bin006]|nr:MAG: hypothetical protein A4E58_02520 [Syntrophorhabdus sp. PtaB.Bin006]